MLSLFRKGGAAQFVVAAIVMTVMVVFILEFRAGRGPSASLKRECAVQGFGECVDGKEYRAAFGLALYRLQIQPKKMRELGLRKQILDGLVERELLVREAERLGVAISEDEIDEELLAGRAHLSLPASNQMLAGQLLLCRPNPSRTQCETPFEMVRVLPVKSVQSGQFDTKIYERVLRSATNRGPKEFKEMQRRELVAARMRDLVRSRVRVSEAEAWVGFERDNSRAIVRTVHVKRDWLAKWAVDLSDAAVDRWAFEHKEPVDDAWKSQSSSFKADCPIVEEIAAPFPPNSEEEEKVEARKKIDDAVAAMKAGASFETAAKLHSAAPTALVGGEQGCLEDNAGEELRAAVGRLKPGAVSPVIETPSGFYMVKLVGKLKQDQVETVGRRIAARRLAAKFLGDELAKKLGSELIDKVKAGTNLDTAARELAERYAGHHEPTKAKAPPTAGVATKTPSTPPALADTEKPAVDISPPFNMRLNPIPEALPTETPAAFAYALEPGALHPTPIATNDGVAIMQLKEKTLAKREDFDKERLSLMRELRKTKEVDAVVRYVARLRKSAGDELKVDKKFAEEPEPGKEESP